MTPVRISHKYPLILEVITKIRRTCNVGYGVHAWGHIYDFHFFRQAFEIRLTSSPMFTFTAIPISFSIKL